MATNLPQGVDFSRLNGWFKDRYADKQADHIPDFAILQRPNSNIPFVPMAKEQLGNYYKQAVVVKRPQGFTYNANGGVFALNGARGMQTVGAQIQGVELALEERFSVAALMRAQGSDQAFGDTFSTATKAMDLAAKHRLEVSLLYGSGASPANFGEGIGATPNSGTSNVSTSATISGSAYQGSWVSDTTHVNYVVVNIDPSQWAAGIWIPAEGASVSVYQGGSTYPQTSATIISNTGSGDTTTFDLISVLPATKQIVLAGTAVGTAAIATYANVNTQFVTLFFGGAYGVEMVGLNNISSITTGSLFGVTVDYNSVFRGNTMAVNNAILGSGTTITYGKITNAISILQGRGIMEDTTVLIAPRKWSQINNDLAANRYYTSSTKMEMDRGAKNITLYSSTGVNTIQAHPCVKEGHAFIIPSKNAFMRVGSTDVTFRNPASDSEFFYEIPGYMGSAIRAYTDQALYCERPGHLFRVTGILDS